MSRIYEITCCHCGSLGGSVWVEDHQGERALDTLASENGWVNYSDQWYCPHCAKDIPQ